MNDANEMVRKTLEAIIHDHNIDGLQTAATLDGELVVDAWAGLADRKTRTPVKGETLFTAFSVSKGITATCIHLLVERGLLDYEAPIARYWPEFGTRGKSKATIRHALTHQAGIPKDPPEMDVRMMCDWEAVTRATAELEALWEPGTRTDYHALTYGWILGEVVRRVDGRPISLFLQEELCSPLGIEDLYFGIPASRERHVATLQNEENMEIHLEGFNIAKTHPLVNAAETFNRSDVRRAVIPAAGAITNARSLARHYAMLAAGGEINGVRLLSKSVIDHASTPVLEDPEHADIRWWTRHGLGYTLGGDVGPLQGLPRAFGYEGVGTIAFADPEHIFSFAFLSNTIDLGSIHNDSPMTQACRVVMQVLGIV